MATSSAPSQRVYHTLLYDSKRNRVLLFGGQAYYHWGMDLRDVWSFDFSSLQWELIGELEAGAVYAMAHDEERARAIMLNVEGETWVYDVSSGTWEKRNPAHAPTARYGHRMVFEAHTGRVVLFGGFQAASVAAPPLDETWVYEDAADAWTLLDLREHPPARSYHSMVYDPLAERTVVWGGRPFSARSDVTLWALDSRSDTWEPLPQASGPKSRYTYAPMVYCSQTQRIVMYGGLELTGQFEGRLVDEVWLYDLGACAWARKEVADGPGARSQHAMVFASVAGKLIVFGGECGGAYAGTFTNDLWLWDPSTMRWEELHPPLPDLC